MKRGSNGPLGGSIGEKRREEKKEKREEERKGKEAERRG